MSRERHPVVAECLNDIATESRMVDCQLTTPRESFPEARSSRTSPSVLSSK